MEKTIEVGKLQASLNSFLSAMESVLNGVPSELAKYKLDEMEIEVEVNAEGSVGLLGTGGKVGGEGSLTLKLKRS